MLLFGRDQNADPTASPTQKESELLPWAVGCRSQTCRLWWKCQEGKLHTHCPWILCLEGRNPQDFSLRLWLRTVQHSLCDPVILAETLNHRQQFTHLCLCTKGRSIKAFLATSHSVPTGHSPSSQQVLRLCDRHDGEDLGATQGPGYTARTGSLRPVPHDP